MTNHYANLEVVLAPAQEVAGLHQADWATLLEDSESDNVFLHPAWITAWLEAWPAYTSSLVLIKQSDKVLGGGVFFSQDADCLFVGEGRADYQEVLLAKGVSPNEAKQVVAAMFDALRKEHSSVRQFRLKRVPEWSFLRQGNIWCNYRVGESYTVPAPFLDMSEADVMMNKKSLKRHENKLNRTGTVDFRTYSESSEVLPRLDGFFDQHIARWQQTDSPSLFLQETNRRFYQLLAQKLDNTGILQYSELRLDDDLVAAHFGFLYQSRFYWYKPTYKPELSKLSPGEVLIRNLFRHAQNQNARIFDFTIGNERFKQRFSTGTQTVADLFVTANTVAWLGFGAKQSIKSAMASARDGTKNIATSIRGAK